MKRFSQQLFPILFILSVVQTFEVIAQDFYPLEARNTWSYQVFYNNYPQPTESVITQLGVLRDTLMPNGRIYTRLGHSDALGGTFVRVDSDYVYYFSPYSGNDVPMYNLRAAPGTVDTIVGWNLLRMSRVASITAQQIFGSQRMVRRYLFDGLVQYEVSLADGFGIVDALDKADGGWPFYAWWSIRGCIIRDTLYGTTVSVPENQGLPTRVNLYQNYPNPFNPNTTIKYQIPSKSYVMLTVFDVLGREVESLVNAIEEPGNKSVQWNTANVTSGVYFYQLRAEGFIETRKMLLVK